MLDENLDRRLKRFFGEEHEVVTVRERGWGGKENGELIEDAQREFDALMACSSFLIPVQQSCPSPGVGGPSPPRVLIESPT